ncbi:MAG: hypothetical protein CMO40_09125 [Verrucomicrobiaceae bacterium]|nr:hypothetical protein [Verrucomicrobiaceae bacterium]
MPVPSTSVLICAPVLLTSALPGVAQQELSSENHPSLRRAFAESPAADKDANGTLSLAEYEELIKKERPHDAENPKAPLLPLRPNGDLVIHDFENSNVMHPPGWSPVRHQSLKDHPLGWHMGGTWQREGDAFNRDLQSSTKMMKRRVGPYEGKFFLTSIGNTERATGRLLSPPFLLEQDFVLITMSGGGHPGKVCVNLQTANGIVRSATGRNDDYFEKVAIDVREFRGQLARIEITDQHEGLWGHLNIDELLLSSKTGEARLVDQRPPPSAPGGGVVLTSKARHEGILNLEDGELLCEDRSLEGEVLLAINPLPENSPRLPGAVHLRDGEIWNAEVRAVEGIGKKKVLNIRSQIFGEKKVPLDEIASMEFVAAGPEAPREAGTFYRKDGDPMPGSLIWVRAKDIAIRSPLGVIPVPRAQALRFVLATPEPADRGRGDEIGLADGSLLYGATSFEGSQLVIQHQGLGELKVPWTSVRYLRRTAPDLVWLDATKGTVLESIGPALPPPAPRLTTRITDTHARSLRIMPHTILHLALPESLRPAIFRGQLHLVPGNRARLEITVLDGSSPVWTRKINPGTDPIPLSLKLPAGRELTIRVTFDGPLAFPCGIDLRDAHVIRTAN